MPSLRAFFLGLPIGLWLAACGYFGIFLMSLGAGGGYGSRNTMEVIQRKEELAKACDLPRFFVVGGSGALYGIKARMIADAIGIPSFNLGSHAGLGTDYLLSRTARLLRQGDTVLLIPEYELYDWGRDTTDTWVDEFFIDFVTAHDPEYFWTLPLLNRAGIALKQDFLKIRKGLEDKLKRESRADNLKATDPAVFSVANIDAHGDLINHHRADKPGRFNPEYRTAKPDLGIMDMQTGGWREMDKFLAIAREKGVRVIAAWPNTARDSAYASREFQPKRDAVHTFWAERGVPMLGDPFDAMVSRDDLFDTVYHPVFEAAEARTVSLIEFLKQALCSLDREPAEQP